MGLEKFNFKLKILVNAVTTFPHPFRTPWDPQPKALDHKPASLNSRLSRTGRPNSHEKVAPVLVS